MEDIRAGVCPLCRHNKIVSSWPADPGTYDAEEYQMAVARSSKTRSHGLLSLFVCQRCGFGQWFAFAPEQIPIDEKLRTELIVGPEPEGSYR